jgi:hypothetical protein
MADVLSKLVNRGFVPKLDGDDSKLAKIQEASNALATEFAGSPRRLIRAILAGIDPDVAADDPEIAAAEAAVLQRWSTMRTVHTDSPINLLRAVLLDACFQAAQGPLAAVVWLTIADHLRFMRLGLEGAVVHERIDGLSIRVEEQALVGLGGEKPKPPGAIKIPKIEVANVPTTPNVAEKATLAAIAKKRFPFSMPAGGNWQHLMNATNDWMSAFPDGLSSLLSELQQGAEQNAQTDRSKFVKAFADVTAAVERSLNAQQEWARAVQTEYEMASRVQIRALWWAEALYCPSLRVSYRRLPATVATVAMSFDLADEVGAPAPASVGYLLAETIAKLPSASFDESWPVWSILDELREHRGRLPGEWRDRLELPTEGCLSVRDLLVLALHENGSRYETAKDEFHARFEEPVNLPDFGHTIYRQEQAYRIVQGLK